MSPRRIENSWILSGLQRECSRQIESVYLEDWPRGACRLGPWANRVELERGKGGWVELIEGWWVEGHWIECEVLPLSSTAPIREEFVVCTRNNASCSLARGRSGINAL